MFTQAEQPYCSLETGSLIFSPSLALRGWDGNPEQPPPSSKSRLSVAETGLAAAITINCTAMYWYAGLQRISDGARQNAIAA